MRICNQTRKMGYNDYMHLSPQRIHKKSKNYASFIYSEYTIEYSLLLFIVVVVVVWIFCLLLVFMYFHHSRQPQKHDTLGLFSVSICDKVKHITSLSCIYNGLSRKKSNYVIQFFELHWRSRFSHFFLRKFGKVKGHLGPNDTSDKTYTQKRFWSSGSNETMQNVLASTFIFWEFFKNIFAIWV